MDETGIALQTAEHLIRVTERAERIMKELRAATSEAAGTVKDLQAAMKEARAQVDEYAARRVTADLSEFHDQVVADMREIGTTAVDKTNAMMRRLEETLSEKAALEGLMVDAANKVARMVERKFEQAGLTRGVNPESVAIAFKLKS